MLLERRDCCRVWDTMMCTSLDFGAARIIAQTRWSKPSFRFCWPNSKLPSAGYYNRVSTAYRDYPVTVTALTDAHNWWFILFNNIKACADILTIASMSIVTCSQTICYFTKTFVIKLHGYVERSCWVIITKGVTENWDYWAHLCLFMQIAGGRTSSSHIWWCFCHFLSLSLSHTYSYNIINRTLVPETCVTLEF